jgi:excisionase family DNA binding protein
MPLVTSNGSADDGRAMDTVFTVAEVAKTLKVDERDALGLIVRGELGALELGPGEYRVTAADLRRFINVRRADFRRLEAPDVVRP